MRAPGRNPHPHPAQERTLSATSAAPPQDRDRRSRQRAFADRVRSYKAGTAAPYNTGGAAAGSVKLTSSQASASASRARTSLLLSAWPDL